VIQDRVIIAAGILEGVGKDRHAAERPVGEDRLGEADDGGRLPSGVEGDRAEWVPE
jgi:hypothetical protein